MFGSMELIKKLGVCWAPHIYLKGTSLLRRAQFLMEERTKAHGEVPLQVKAAGECAGWSGVISNALDISSRPFSDVLRRRLRSFGSDSNDCDCDCDDMNGCMMRRYQISGYGSL